MKCKSYERFFKTFANSTRIDIIELLFDSDYNVSEICEILGEEQSKISHNLKQLQDCNFISQAVVGKTRVYSLNSKTIRPLFELVREHVSVNCSGGCSYNRMEK